MGGCVDFPYDLEEDMGGFKVWPGSPPQGGCTVTTWTGDNCDGKKVQTYSADCVKEFRWNYGYQENYPNSARVTGEHCDKVEFYDEDSNHANYEDNVMKHGEGCVNFPYDLEEDLAESRFGQSESLCEDARRKLRLYAIVFVFF